MFFCEVCNVSVPKYSAHKKTNVHKSNCLLQTRFDNVHIIATAFRNRIISYRVNPRMVNVSLELFLTQISETICYLIKDQMKKHKSVKVNFELFVWYILPKNYEKSLKSFNTKYNVVVQNTDILSLYKSFCGKLICKCSEFELSESGWTIESISHLEINIVKYNPLRGGSYLPLPKRIVNTKSCLNIKNEDQHCFLWCIVADMFPAKTNPNRTSSYPHYSELFNISDMSFPPSFNDIKRFEINNSNISINIYGLDNNVTVTGPLYKTKSRRLYHVNLLYISNNRKSHFCLIKSFEKLVHKQLTQHKSKIYLCDECFIYFHTEEKLNCHECAGIQTILPEKGTEISFINYERTQRVPIVIYGDFESLLREYSDKHKSTHVENIQVHEATCFAYYICCNSNPELNDFVSYRGPDCSKKFVKSLTNDVKRLYKVLLESENMIPLTEDEHRCFINSTECHICKNKFSCNDNIVKDHDHFTGKYRGPAHDICNLNAKQCTFIPIVFHNLSGYDSHLFINELSKINGRIHLIPRTKEKYISFTKFITINATNVVKLKFIDSYNFLSSSMDKLVKTMNPEDFKHLKSFFNNNTLFDIVRRKGIYCYDYIDSWERYDENKLPEPSKFFNKLTSESISDKDYEHALNVWKTFDIKNLGEYTDLYLKCDVLLLCDVFEKFRKMSLNNYGLDPCYYVSSPSLSWDAMLLYTKIKLDLISDLEIYQMIEKGIRGGLAQCSLRYAKANNEYLTDYNSEEPDSFLIYLDCVNLYGYAMMQKLPVGGFRFLLQKEILNFDVMSLSSDSDIGFILEVDLHYPDYLHDNHSDLPFAPEKFVPFCSRNAKLIANLFNKHRYVIHYIHLKECLNNGLQLLKIYRILAFHQSKFLESYISLNTGLRQNATSDFERDFFKKQNNSIFGKTIENKRKQVDVKLVNIWRDKSNRTKKFYGAEKYVSAPNFNNFSVISESLVTIQMNQTKIVLDRPIYIGFSILEIAKCHLYKFHYSVMKRIYENKLKLCYTDTDSLLYLIQTKDFYEDLKAHLKYFDTSNFEKDNVFNIPMVNAKTPGYFKDEMGGEIISEFVGLGAKLYCIDSKISTLKKAKGVKKCVTKKLNIEKYKKVLLNNEILRDDMCIIRSKNHRIFTQKINKVILSNSDDKRQIMDDKITTLPWGHHKTIF